MTPDEKRVLQFLAHGYSLDEMAWLLDISPGEMRARVQSLLVKYRVQSKRELVRKTARRNTPTLEQKGTPVTPLTQDEERVRLVFGCKVNEMAVLLDASPDEV
jgi:DNA-binding CsgD family transcriptional regulator